MSDLPPELLERDRLIRDLRDRRRRQEEKAFLDVYRAASATDPTVEADAIRTASLLGIPRETMPEDFAKLHVLAKEKQAQQFVSSIDRPALRRQLLDLPFVRLLHDDLGNLKDYVGTFDWLSRNYESGETINEAGILKTKQALARANGVPISAADQDRLNEIDYIQRTAELETGVFDEFSKLLGQMVGPVINSLAVGATAAGVASVGGPGAAATAFTYGTGTAFFAQSAITEFGHNYGDTYDALIAQGVDPKEAHETAAMTAGAYGLAAATLETVGGSLIGAPLKGATKNLAGRFLSKGISRATHSKATAEFVKETLKGLLGEVGTEGAQELLGGLAQNVAGHIEGKDIGPSFGEALQQAGEVMWKTAKGMAVLAPLGPALHYASDVRQVKQAQVTQQFFGQLAEKAKNTELLKRSPDALSQLVAARVAGTPMDRVHIEASKLVEGLKAANVTREQFAHDLPEVAKQLEVAERSGDDVSIPMGEFAAKVAPNPELYQAIQKSIRLPNGWSVEQAETWMAEQAANRIADAERVAAAAAKIGDWAKQALAVENRVAEELRKDTRIPADRISLYASLHRTWVETQAAREGTTPEAFDATHRLTVKVERDAPTDIGVDVVTPSSTVRLSQFVPESVAGWEAVQRKNEMVAAGASPKEILKETGLQQGAEGAWMYELDDSKSSWKQGLMPSEEAQQRAKAEGRELTVGDMKPEQWSNLESVLEHPQLFEAVPGLKQISVMVFEPGEYGGARGFFRRGAKIIGLRRDLPIREAFAILHHEVQHGIQNEASFAQGGSPDGFTFEELEAIARQDADRLSKAHPEGSPLRKEVEQYQAMDEELEEGTKKLRGMTTPSPERLKLALRLRELINQTLDAHHALGAAGRKLLWALRGIKAGGDTMNRHYLSADRYEAYHRLAGEAQARNTADFRLHLDADARREKLASETSDVPFGEQVVRPNEMRFSQVSTRVPTAKKATEDPVNEMLLVNMDAVKGTEQWDKLAELVRTYDFLKLPEGASSDAVMESLIEHVVGNLLWLHDQMSPEERARSRLWYDGGRKFVEAWSNRYGISREQAAAVIAVLSPQKDWFVNMTMAERMLDIATALKDAKWDEGMRARSAIVGKVEAKTRGSNIPVPKRFVRKGEDGKVDQSVEAKRASVQDAINAIGDRTLAQLMDAGELDLAAYFVRVYDQTYNERTLARLTPEGGAFGVAAQRIQWTAYPTLQKVLSVIQDGSMENIHQQLGKEHKVRNFHDNLVAPNSPRGHTTIDTHAVGAGYLMPLSSQSPYVSQAWGGQGAAKSGITGVSGLYPVLLEAYRRAGAARGLLPREMQSITWEQVRAMFDPALKRTTTQVKRKLDKIQERLDEGEITEETAEELREEALLGDKPKIAAQLWKEYGEGKRTLDETREELLKLAGGYEPKFWADAPPETPLAATYKGKSRDAMEKVTGKKVPPAPVSVMVEARPNLDPEILAQWDALTPEQQTLATKEILETVTQEVREKFGTYVELVQQLGAWMDDPAPSIALRLEDPSYAQEIADYVGARLAQESMFLLSSKQVPGTEAAKVVRVQLPEGMTPDQINALYFKLRGIRVGEEQPVVAHSTAFGYMTIAVDPKFEPAFSTAVKGVLANTDGDFVIAVEDGFAGSRTAKEHYGSSSSETGIVSTPGHSDRLRIFEAAFANARAATERATEGGDRLSQAQPNAAAPKGLSDQLQATHPRVPASGELDARADYAANQNPEAEFTTEDGQTVRIKPVGTDLPNAFMWSLGDKGVGFFSSFSDGTAITDQAWISPEARGQGLYSQVLKLLASMHPNGVSSDEVGGVSPAAERAWKRAGAQPIKGTDRFELRTGGATERLSQPSSAALREWLADSQVTEVVYHGSETPGFSRFRKAPNGIWFAFDPKNAEPGNASAAGGVYPVHVRAVNPMTLDAEGIQKFRLSEHPKADMTRLVNEAKAKGHDSIIIPDYAVVVFEPTQIKSIHNTNPGASPNILKQGDAKPRGQFDPATNTIFLHEGADATTVLHEMSHFWLSTMFKVASMPTASERTKADAQTLLKWFGIKDLDTWNAMTLKEQEPFHEQFAYSAEAQWFGESGAPSADPEMKRMFRVFGRWVRATYRQARDVLNRTYHAAFGRDLPALTPDVRAVFDRMLAAEDAVEFARSQQALEPMLTEKPPDITDEDWRFLQDLNRDTIDEATETLQKDSLRAMKWTGDNSARLVRKLQRETRATRRMVEARVREALSKQPVYKAREALRGGTAVAAEGGWKNLKLRSFDYHSHPMAHETRDILVRGMLAEDGFSADSLAEMFGFEDGAELVRALIVAPPLEEAVQAETDATMLREHSDLLDPNAIREKVAKAMHTETRGRMVAAELKWLAKITTPVRLLARAAREFVRDTIGKTTIRNVRPYDHALAAVRFRREADKALRKGDREAAALAKRRELLETQRERVAIEVREEIEALQALVRKLLKSDKALAATHDVDYVAVARYLASAFKLLPDKETRPSAYIEKLQAYNPGLFEKLRPVLERAQLWAEGAAAEGRNIQSWRDLTVDEFRDLSESIEAMWHQSTGEKKFQDGQKTLELADVVSELQAEDAKSPPAPPQPLGEQTPGEKRAGMWHRLKQLIYRPEHWALRKDGGEQPGPFTRYFWRPVREAVNRYVTSRNIYVKRITGMVQKLRPNLKQGTIEFRTRDGRLLHTFGRGNGGLGHSELVAALLHTGNKSNLERLLTGRKWGTLDKETEHLDTSHWDHFVEQMIQQGYITKDIMDFVQSVWDLNEEVKPLAQRAHRSLFGFYFKEIEATPLQTPWGSYRGGYVPAKLDPSAPSYSAKQSLEDLEKDFRQQFASTGSGFTKERAVHFGEPLLLDLDLVPSHIDSVLKFSHLQPAIRQIEKLAKQKDMAAMLEARQPGVWQNMLLPWLQRVATQSVTKPGMNSDVDRFWSAVRSTVGMSTMFANVGNALQQVTGLLVAALKVKPRYLFRGLGRLLHERRGLYEDIAGKSEFMRNRQNNQLHEQLEQITGLTRNQGKLATARAFAKKHAYFLQSHMQNMVDSVVWSAAYEQSLEASKATMTDAAADAEAVKAADAAVRQTQSSFDPTDVAGYEQGSPFYRLLTMFTGYFNTLANLQADRWVAISKKAGWAKAGPLIYLYALGFAAPTLLADAISRTLRGQWDDEDGDGDADVLTMDYLFMGQLRAALAQVPVAGSSLLMPALNAFDDQSWNDRMTTSPVMTTLERAVGGSADAIKAITGFKTDREGNVVGPDGGHIRDAMTLLGLGIQLPLGGVGSRAGYVTDVLTGTITPANVLDLVRGVVSGAPGKMAQRN